MYNFECNVLLSIATNIAVLLMTAFVLQGHVCWSKCTNLHKISKWIHGITDNDFKLLIKATHETLQNQNRQTDPPPTHTHVRTRTHAHTQTQTQTQTHARTHARTHTHTHTHAHTHTHTHTDTQTHRHTDTDTHTHTRTPTHTHQRCNNSRVIMRNMGAVERYGTEYNEPIFSPPRGIKHTLALL